MLNTIGNCALVVESTNGTFERGGAVDSLFVASAPDPRRGRLPPARASAGPGGPPRLFWPAAFALVAVAVLIVAGVVDTSPVAVVLAAATLVVLVARALLAFRDNRRLLDRAQREAVTDALTGLGNRRQLRATSRELEAIDRVASAHAVLFDLDGFKAYNDAFGHPAGDALLARLAAGSAPRGARHRPTGWAATSSACSSPPTASAPRPWSKGDPAALIEHGDAFSITASHGAVSMPEEARTSELSLQLADRRMYAHKDRRRSSPSEQTRAALQALLDERSPAASARHREPADLAYLVAQRQGAGQPDLDHLVRAAELHDVGRVALPAGLATRGSEDPLVAQQTLIAERILAAAPALVPVGRIVRSLHERYDGGGYPDGLAGQDIPAPARILERGSRVLRAAGPTGARPSRARSSGWWRRAAAGWTRSWQTRCASRPGSCACPTSSSRPGARCWPNARPAAVRRGGSDGPALGIGRAYPGQSRSLGVTSRSLIEPASWR